MTGRTTRAERLAQPRATDAVRMLAEASGGCIRPVQLRRTNIDTGQAEQVMVPCSATLADLCPACAERARNLRAAQCREGWHCETEPFDQPAAPDDWQAWLLEKRADVQKLRDHAATTGQDTAELDELTGELDGELAKTGIRGKADPGRKGATRRQRSTRRRQDAPGPAPQEDQPAHHRQGLHHGGRKAVPAVDVPHPDLRHLRQGHRGRHPR